MTIYPLEFHRRCERKWERRAELLRVFESSPQPDGYVPSYRTDSRSNARRRTICSERSEEQKGCSWIHRHRQERLPPRFTSRYERRRPLPSEVVADVGVAVGGIIP
jgi:hypothetical protein